MHCLTFGCRVLVCIVVGAAGSGLATAAEPPERVVVLQSGGVLTGKVSVAGERYVVEGPNSVVEVPVIQVLLVADSLDAAYEDRRRRLPDTAEAHLKLAEWCLRYQLAESAARELADARRLDPHDPRIALFERRLAVASVKKTPRKSAPSSESAAPPHADELRELEAATKELPPGVVERFTRRVQPLLVNSCTASGCHQPNGEQDFKLDRAVLHGLSNRRTTLRNLVATLELVDREAPQRSALLTVPRRSHGGMKRPVYGPRQEPQLKLLSDWAAMVAEREPFAAQIAAKESAESPLPMEASSPFSQQPQALVDQQLVPDEYEGLESLRPTVPVRRGARLSAWQPTDEFDAEIFNRAVRKERDSRAAAESTATQ